MNVSTRCVAHVVLLLGLALAAHPVLAKENGPEGRNTLSLVPMPVKAQRGEGQFVLTAATKILTAEALGGEGRYLAEALQPATGFELAQEEGNEPRAGAIALLSSSDRSGLGEEGYRLEVTPDRIVIAAAKPAGAFYACQTLRQLLPAEIAGKKPPAKGIAWTLPCVCIEDRPRFAWRGMMLDPARHFLTVDFLKRFIDLAASYKLNRLQLHLTDDQAWRIQIKKYPELTDVKRWPIAPAKVDEGVYRQDELGELVAYAARRHVLLVPEIEMPGHNAVAAWTLRERVLCANNPYRDRNRAFDAKSTFEWTEPCAANPQTLEICQNILREVMGVFPGPYVHLGGDEYCGLSWAQCPDCRKLIESQNLRRGESEELKQLFAHCRGSKEKYLVYRYFMTRLCDFVRAQGRRPVLWDDLAWRGRFPQGATIMQWHYVRGEDHWQNVMTPEDPAVEAVQADRDAIIAPFSHLYFDLDSTLEQVYRFDPMPPGLTSAQQARILGPHAPLWEQHPEQIAARTLPRLYALAEIGWSPRQPRDWPEFARRAAVQEKRRMLAGDKDLGSDR